MEPKFNNNNTQIVTGMVRGGWDFPAFDLSGRGEGYRIKISS